MNSPRILVVLMSLLLAPSAIAVVDPGVDVGVGEVDSPWGCKPKSSEWERDGFLKIIGRGAWRAEGYAINGCGGNGCDDAVSGDYIRSNGDRHDWEIHEVRTAYGCKVSCWAQTYAEGTSGIRGDEVDGYIHLAVRHDDGSVYTYFQCGPDANANVVFKGSITHYCGPCPTLVPSIEYGSG
jgi:hypothetical protein